MNRTRAGRCRRGFAGLALAAGVAVRAGGSEPVLYEGSGGWGVVSGVPESTRSPDGNWHFEEGVWIGRIPAATDSLMWGGRRLPRAEALPPPLAPAVLPLVRNPFGPCVVRSLSVRYDSVVRSRRWSLVFAPEGQEPEFHPLVLPGGRQAELRLMLEDVVSGRRRELRPTRQGREKALQEGEHDARFYAGTLDEGDLEWSLVVVPGPRGRPILQGRVMSMNSPNRLFRLRVLVRTGVPGAPVLQDESPPAVVAGQNGTAFALFADLAEPRRFRAVADEPESMGIEFDLAVAKATGNFPQSATFSLEADAWEPRNPGAVAEEAIEQLAHVGGGVALPEAVARGEAGALAVFEPGRMELSHPGGFQDRADVLHYLMLKTAGLFPDRDWAASAFLCAVQDAGGGARIQLEGDRAILAVNPDPDLQTLLEMGQNRGRTVLDRIRRSGAPAVFLRASASPPGLDYNGRALHLCDYPAVWEEGSTAPGVDLRHAEIELIAALACVLKEAGICLLVGDAGPLAPFSTYHADALVCESADPGEMRRQRALAGQRPVLWRAESPAPETEELARHLGFVRPGKINED